jgi:hypothetical protein
LDRVVEDMDEVYFGHDLKRQSLGVASSIDVSATQRIFSSLRKSPEITPEVFPF